MKNLSKLLNFIVFFLLINCKNLNIVNDKSSYFQNCNIKIQSTIGFDLVENEFNAFEFATFYFKNTYHKYDTDYDKYRNLLIENRIQPKLEQKSATLFENKIWKVHFTKIVIEESNNKLYINNINFIFYISQRDGALLGIDNDIHKRSPIFDLIIEKK